PFDGCALERSTHGEAVVRRETGLRATGAGFRGAGIPVARRAAGCNSRTKRGSAGVRAEKTRHQRVCVADGGERPGAAEWITVGISVDRLEKERDGVVRRVRCERRGLERTATALGAITRLTNNAVTHCCDFLV